MENSMEVPQKTRVAILSSNPTPGHIYPNKTTFRKDAFTSMFIAGLFIIAKTWKQSKRPSTEKWIKNMWYINTVGYSVSSVPQSCPTLCDPVNRSTPGLPVHHQLREFTETHVHWVSDAVQPSHPLSSPSPPAPNPSQHQGLSNESTLRMRWPKYWSFSFSISPSNEHPGLVSFRMDWLDLLAVQQTLKSLLQHHSSKASILRCSVIEAMVLN